MDLVQDRLVELTAIFIMGGFLYYQIRRVHDTFNSKMDKLLKLTDTEAFARGVLSGKKSESGELDEGFSDRMDDIVSNARQSGVEEGRSGRGASLGY